MHIANIRKKISKKLLVVVLSVSTFNVSATWWIMGPVMDLGNLFENIVGNIEEIDTYLQKSEALRNARKLKTFMSGGTLDIDVKKAAIALSEEQKLKRKLRNDKIADDMQSIESICFIPTTVNGNPRTPSDAGFSIGTDSSHALGGAIYIKPIDDSCSRAALVDAKSEGDLSIAYPNDDIENSRENKPFTQKLKAIATSALKDDGSIDTDKRGELLDASLIISSKKLTLEGEDAELFKELLFIAVPPYEGISSVDKSSVKRTIESYREFAFKNIPATIVTNNTAERIPSNNILPASLERKQGFSDSYHKDNGYERFAYGENMYTPEQIFREKMILKGFMAVQAVDKYKKMLNEETLLAVKLANKIR